LDDASSPSFASLLLDDEDFVAEDALTKTGPGPRAFARRWCGEATRVEKARRRLAWVLVAPDARDASADAQNNETDIASES
jgi:hypothetical protein